MALETLRAVVVEHFLVLRFAKLVAVMVFVDGALGTALVDDPRAREQLGLRVAPAGFVATWAVGALYAWAQQRELFTSWILLAAVLSFFAVSGTVVAAMAEKRARRVHTVAIVALLGACVAAMVWKP